ncbi:hypothetical protein GBAR_LOCUS2958, partial [Geodia barretti]
MSHVKLSFLHHFCNAIAQDTHSSSIADNGGAPRD